MAVIEKGSFEVISRSPTQTRRVGMRLGELLLPGDVVCLEGNSKRIQQTLQPGDPVPSRGEGQPSQMGTGVGLEQCSSR